MQNMQTNQIPLHDIKPLLEIEDYSFYYFLGIAAVVVIIILAGSYLLYKHFRQRNLREPKKAAYDLTEYGATFQADSERHQKTYHDMVEFDSETLRIIELYRGMIDV